MKESKKIKQAVALKYDMENDIAPRIVARGQGIVAENIVKLGEEKEVPVYQDDTLIDQLKGLEVGTFIPTELYEVVAQVLVFIDMVDRQKGKKE